MKLNLKAENANEVMSFVNEQWLPQIEKLISKGAVKYECAV